MGTSGFLELEGGRIYFEVDGEGHPLLLIHGGLGSLRMWDRQVPAFSERHRVIRYDTRGFGRTQTDDVAFVNLDDAVAVLDHVEARSVYVVGQSRGASIALDLTIARPDRVDAFVSVAGGIGGYEAQRPPDVIAAFDEMDRLWDAEEWSALAELETRLWVDGWGQPSGRIDAELRRTVFGWIEANHRAEKVEGRPQALDPPAAERLDEVRVPTMVMIGEVDEVGGVEAERHLAASVAGSQVVAFPRVAHMIHLEEPDRFNRLVLEFLAGAAD
jgi:pimeloyl-ACP methyl ester carboxylesterase